LTDNFKLTNLNGESSKKLDSFTYMDKHFNI